MTPTERQRIEFDSKLESYKYVDDNLRDAFINGYRSGATAEHDKARNQAIDEAIIDIGKLNDNGMLYYYTVIKTLESLKTIS